MKNPSYLISGLAVIALFVLAWWFWPGTQTPSLQNPTNPTGVNLSIHINSSGPSPANSVKVVPTPSQWVDKVVAMKEIWAGENAEQQDFYGKIIDQHGQPVPDAMVTGELGWLQGLTEGPKVETHKTRSDKNGEFEFTGLHGWQLGVIPSKQGYELARNTIAMQLPSSGKTSPAERAIFKMWKLKGSEPMTFARIHTYIPCDGSATSFNLLTGKHGNDMIVKLTRNPVNIIQGKPFDWIVTLEIANGGFVEQADAYPNEAPVEGYKPSITINMPANMQNWTEDLSRSFYFKSRGGQNYGRMTIKINAAFQPPPTSFNADIYTNPAGSRNLEYDSTKQIEAN